MAQKRYATSIDGWMNRKQLTRKPSHFKSSKIKNKEDFEDEKNYMLIRFLSALHCRASLFPALVQVTLPIELS